MSEDALIETVGRLFGLLSERRVEYVLVGGIALLQYVEGRNTEDVDIIVAPASLNDLPEIEIASREPDFARGRFGQLQVDILLTSNPLFETVRRKHTAMRAFAERDIPCATVEGLLLLKLYALPSLYRQGNFARVGLYENDIATLLHEYHPPLGPLLDELACHLSEADLAALGDALADVRKRIERFENGRGGR